MRRIRFRDLHCAVAFPLPPLQDPDAPVSWQSGITVATLTKRVAALPVDEATEMVLDALRNRAD